MKNMIDFEKVAHFIADKMATVEVRSNRCSQIRSPLSSCKQCLEICPVQGIQIDRHQVQLASQCLDCGLCASACPTEALRMKEPSIEGLLDKIQRAYEQDCVVNISCRRNKKVDKTSITIPCIGSLPLEILLVLQSLPYHVHMIYDLQECSQCAVANGADVYHQRLQQIETMEVEWVSKPGGIQHSQTQVKPTAKKREQQAIDTERRALLGSFFGGLKKMPKTALDRFVGDDQLETETTPIAKVTDFVSLQRIEILKKNLYQKYKNPDAPLVSLQHPIENKPCYFCNACVTLCPMGALENQDGKGLVLRADRCCGCHLCVDVCFHKSLKMSDVPLTAVMSAEAVEIAAKRENQCVSCGKEFSASQEMEQCLNCQRKAIYGM